MKKTLLLFAMLLGVVGAWAQEDNFVTPETGKYYIIKGLSTTAPYLGKSNTNDAFSVVASESDAGIFYVEASNNAGKYYMTCVNATSATQFFGHNGDVRLVGQKQDVTLEAATDGKYYIAVGNNWMHNNKENSIGTGSKGATTENQWGFIEAPLNTAPEITFTNVQPNGDRLTLYVDDNNTLTFSASSPTELGAKAKFTYTVINGKYVFFNKSKNCYLIWRGYTSGGFNSNKGTLSYYNATYCDWELNANDENHGDKGFYFRAKRENTSKYGSLILLTTSTTTPKSYVFDAYETGAAWEPGNSKNQQFSNLFTVQINCNLYNEASGSTFQLTHSVPNIGVKPTISLSGIVGATLSDEVFDGGSEYSANITFPFPVSKEVYISSFKGTKDPGLRKYYVGTGDNIDNVMYGPSEPPVGNMDKWIIEPSCNNNAFTFKIKNVGTSKYITTSATTTTAAKGSVTVTDAGTEFTVDADNRFKLPTTSSALYLSAGSSTSNDQYLGAWTWNGDKGTHYGNCNFIYEPELQYSFTDNAGNIFEGTLDASGNYPWISGAQLSNISFDEMKFNATVTFPIPVSSETVANPILIGQGSWDGANSFEKLWKVVDGNVMVVDGTPSLGASMWLIYPTLTGSEFTYKIKSVSTDKYVTANLASGNDAEATDTPITLTSTGTEFSYKATTRGSDKGFAYTNDNSVTMYLSRNGSSDNDKLLGVYQASNSHQGNGIRFPEFTEYNVTIGETGYTTLYSPFTAFTYSEDLEIYTITSAPQDGRVNLNLITSPQADDVSNYIYINQGVIIKGNPGTYTFNLFDDENYYDAEDWENNLLEGSVTNTYVQGDAYVLSAPGGVENVGLYKALLNKDANGEAGTTHFKNNAGKAYLPASALSAEAAESRFFLFGFGDDMETGITETENGNVKPENTEVYDLSGRRVQGAQKGIFIVNGKKVVR